MCASLLSESIDIIDIGQVTEEECVALSVAEHRGDELSAKRLDGGFDHTTS